MAVEASYMGSSSKRSAAAREGRSTRDEGECRELLRRGKPLIAQRRIDVRRRCASE